MATKAKNKRRLTAILVGLVLTLCGVGVIIWLHGMLKGGKPPQQKVVQEIHMIRPPPPPPDTPPPPPPPPEEKVNVPDPEHQEPDPTPSNDPPPSEQLGLDAEGGAGSDAFGLAGHPGGRDLMATGGSAYAWYAGLLKNEILANLSNEKQARAGEYTVIVRVWVKPDGTIERVSIAQSSGSKERDHAIEAALARISRLSQAPPADMPEPISLRIVSRG
jgi:protein TonB